jgi:thymidylate kinase
MMNRSNEYPAVETQPVLNDVLKVDMLRAESCQVLPLIRELCHALAMERIAYCHWKSNHVLERSASGKNDLDLLVNQADGPRFAELLNQLGFKQAKAPTEKQMPGVLDYFGYDEATEKLVHVHAHYQLVFGHDMSKNYRLPIEEQYLASAVQGELFRVPAPEFEFIVFVLRMAVKHLTWDVMLAREGSLKSAERQELAYLQARVDQNRVVDILQRYLPSIGVELFHNCVQALQPACPTWLRVKTGQQLQIRLQTNARRRLLIDIYLKLWRRAALATRRRVFKSSSKYRLASDKSLIAIVGGDGAGKSTVVDALYDWLSKHFETTRVHMGKPEWSTTTRTIRGILKIGNVLGLYPVESSLQETLNQQSLVSPGYPWLLREVCRARDRYLTYRKARRFAAKGGLVLLDRFPLAQIQLMDGPQTERFLSQLMDGPHAAQFLSPQPISRLARALVTLEKSYYDQIVPPELLIVLRVHPEIAVQRKREEDASTVRVRSTEIWELNWEHTNAHVIDTSKPKTDVLAEVKALIWSEL